MVIVTHEVKFVRHRVRIVFMDDGLIVEGVGRPT